ncbi:MAG TPA: hypothetical protein VG815_04905 [Chloroflexota bacterium]|jgi:hypothetical protein|nr:hypothetical protein [Chloroflexota bacterium]
MRAFAHLILVAPWMDPSREIGDFFDFEIASDIGDRCRRIDLLVSEDEPFDQISDTVRYIQKALPATRTHKLNGYGHFTVYSMNSPEFPELRDLVLTANARG